MRQRRAESSSGVLDLTRLVPGFRNEFHAGLQQAIGKFLVIDGEYIWKYTHSAYDFSVLGSSPDHLPDRMAQFQDSGFCRCGRRAGFHGFTALVVLSHVAARFFAPQSAGCASLGRRGFSHRSRRGLRADLSSAGPAVQARAMGRLQLAFRQRIRSGSGALLRRQLPAVRARPTSAITMGRSVESPLTADQEFEAGFTCNGVPRLRPCLCRSTCLASQFALDVSQGARTGDGE